MTNAAPLAGLTCAQCRYDLAFAQFDGPCPDCAHPVAQSWLASTESLNRTLPAFRRRVSRSGTLLVVLGIGAAFQVGFPPIAAALILSWNLGTAVALALGIIYGLILLVCGICALVWWVSWLMLCRRSDCSLWPAVLERRTPALIGLWLVPAIVVVFTLMSGPLAGSLLAMIGVGTLMSVASFWSYARLIDYCVAVERSVCAPAGHTKPLVGWNHIRVWLVATLVANLAAQAYQAVVVSFPETFGPVIDPAAVAANPILATLEAAVPRGPFAWVVHIAAFIALPTLSILWGRAMRRLGAAIPADARSYRESLGLAVEPVRVGDVAPPPQPPPPPPPLA